ncbi:lipid-A-disaccharide synthase [Lewinella sp. W8]|uniref:lipid-A-disaccharide synthase n=1 Tax=Lewinella sp. W8 TaxID=2528208 RepID=UPI00106862C4|nr:lipid-A-disaccharide synthase [Lewinella sp. W8]MTB52656.1 lipid-A-disaccharide synthase [Lewinella sp. W8]
MRYYLIAGEASGDLHGANLIRAIREQDPEAEFRAWGGDLMAEAGADIVKHYRDLAFMGFVDVVKNLGTILGNLKFCKRDITAFQPDRLVLIDYPGINLRVARWARPAGYDITYYITPQIWAWHTSRVHQIKANVDRLLVILPFEEAFFARYDVKANFVGHPLLDVVREAESATERPFATTDEPIVALLPGSRRQEITVGLSIMLAAAARHPEYRYVIAGAPAQDRSFYEELIAAAATRPPRLEVVHGQTYDLLLSAHAAMVTSGTATLETALFGVPQVVCYRGNWLNYQIAKRLVATRIKYISLVNLVMDAPVVPELIQEAFNPENLATHLEEILGGPVRKKQLAELRLLREKLGDGGAAQRAAAAIVT